MRIAFLSEGKLYLKEPGREPVELESAFAREHSDRAEKRASRHGWKGAGRDTAGPFSAGAVWGGQSTGVSGQDTPVIEHLAQSSRQNYLIYSLALSASGGVFGYDLKEKEERRFFHRRDFVSAGFTCDPRNDEMIVAISSPDGMAHLEILGNASQRRGRLTDGDARDAFPSHDPLNPDVIYYQSSGAGRDAEGHVLAFGPACIHRMDLSTGALETLLDDPAYDHLAPRKDRAGNLYYIRRPYERQRGVSMGESVKAFVLFPYRLLTAVVGFLDAFTRIFARESLRPASGPDGARMNARRVFLYDTCIRLEDVLKKRDPSDERASLVPATWELVCRDPSGHERVVAKHVAAFTLSSQDELVYTNGFRVWRASQTPELLLAGKLVQGLVVV